MDGVSLASIHFVVAHIKSPQHHVANMIPIKSGLLSGFQRTLYVRFGR